MATIAIARAIEVAEHNGWWVGRDHLIVFDALQTNPHDGIRLEVFPAATAVGGWCSIARDGVGRCFSVWHPSETRAQVVARALDGYLKILNHGI